MNLPVNLPTNARARWAIAVGAALVLLFVVEHFRDAGKDHELVTLHQAIAADSTVRTAAVATTTAAAAVLDTSARAAARADTLWRSAVTRAKTRVDTILVSTMPDTVKIRELVQVDAALIVAGNALADTTRQLRAAAVDFHAKVDIERAAWTKERRDLAHALDVSESRHRHWGLGVTIGPTIVRDPAGVVRAGPIGATVGLTYRW
ncbi:MAG: hypothetical protein JWM41_2925 [Gemmatimonadetes bacterium]|nr:hypothetical protein [Gemmatimonadota bacterium]